MFIRREERIAVNVVVHNGEEPLVGLFQKLTEYVSAPEDKHFLLVLESLEGFGNRFVRFNAGERPGRQHHVAAVGEGFAEGFERPAAHEDGVARGQALDAFQIF